MGIEEWFTAEPDELPLTASQKRQREKLRTEDERRQFVGRACGDDTELRRRVEELV